MVTVLGVSVQTDVETLVAGIVVARGCVVGPASVALDDRIKSAIAEAHDDVGVKGAVRDLLRHGKYKPTGRGKPASEYLLKAAAEDRFPSINNLVDINNLISLRSQLPISLVDLGRAGTDAFVLRRGHPEESYVFNTGGQVIGLHDLLLVAKAEGDMACANPVKDSMATKLEDTSSDVMAVLYAPLSEAARLADATTAFEDALRDYSGASAVASAVLRSGG